MKYIKFFENFQENTPGLDNHFSEQELNILFTENPLSPSIKSKNLTLKVGSIRPDEYWVGLMNDDNNFVSGIKYMCAKDDESKKEDYGKWFEVDYASKKKYGEIKEIGNNELLNKILNYYRWNNF